MLRPASRFYNVLALLMSLCPTTAPCYTHVHTLLRPADLKHRRSTNHLRRALIEALKPPKRIAQNSNKDRVTTQNLKPCRNPQSLPPVFHGCDLAPSSHASPRNLNIQGGDSKPTLTASLMASTWDLSHLSTLQHPLCTMPANVKTLSTFALSLRASLVQAFATAPFVPTAKILHPSAPQRAPSSCDGPEASLLDSNLPAEFFSELPSWAKEQPRKGSMCRMCLRSCAPGQRVRELSRGSQPEASWQATCKSPSSCMLTCCISGFRGLLESTLLCFGCLQTSLR